MITHAHHKTNNGLDDFIQGIHSHIQNFSHEPRWIHTLRKNALNTLLKIGWPSKNQEDWKYTPIDQILNFPFLLAPTQTSQECDSSILKKLFGNLYDECQSIVFLNGHYVPTLSTIEKQSGLTIQSISEAIQTNSDSLLNHLSQYVSNKLHLFSSMNTALIQDGSMLHIHKNSQITKPIHLIHITHEKCSYFIPYRNLILADKNSKSKIIESYVSLSDSLYFNNIVSEIILQEGAHCEHHKLQMESKDAFHIATNQIIQNKNSHYENTLIQLGSKVARNELFVQMQGEGSDCQLNGLYYGNSNQFLDQQITVDHKNPNTISKQNYKGILDNHSEGVFNGRIHVFPKAQQIQAEQMNKNLLLNENAQIHTNPQLEILADDVKCSHGATVGQLDRDALFYLRCRGIAEKKAKQILTYAFANEIFKKTEFSWVQKHIKKSILCPPKH